MKSFSTDRENFKTAMSLDYASILPETYHNLLKRSDLGLKVSGTKIYIFKHRDSASHAKKRGQISDVNLLKRSYQGKISTATKKFIISKLNLWHDSVRLYNLNIQNRFKNGTRKLVMITLTLPSEQAHTDKEIKRKLLVPFLDKLKYHYSLNGYFWRAEAQDNNNIHFHIITDIYIAKKDLQYFWNDTCEKLGYISRFAQKHGHHKPPTTHIAVISNGRKSIKYVLKYTTKETDSRLISGAVWGMHDSIRSLNNFIVPFADEFKREVKNYIDNHRDKVYYNDHMLCFEVKSLNDFYIRLRSIFDHYKHRLFQIYSFIYFEDQPFDSHPGFIIYEGLDYDEIKAITKLPKSKKSLTSLNDLTVDDI